MVAVLQKGEAANLLSLDGGGIKGVSSLVILQAIMDRVREIEDGNGDKKTNDRLPVDYFHLAGGTSTGGIIALMLFRLGMSPEKAKKAYKDMASDIFKRKVNGVFPDKPLKDAIDKTINLYAPDEDKPKKGECKLVNNKAKMFMCATLQERGESILLRSYTPPEDAVPVSENGKNLFDSKFMERITISEAARATSAAPTYFPEVKIQMEGDKKDVVFWDGGLLNNNPIDQVWRARLDLVGDNDAAPKVACVLSIGTSWSTVPAPSMLDALIPEKSTDTGIWASVMNTVNKVATLAKETVYGMVKVLRPVEQMIPFLTNTEAKHLDFSRYMKRLAHRISEADAQTQYFRFNTPTPVYIDMADSTKMKDLEKYTQDWLADKKNANYVDACAKALAKKVGPTK